LVSYKNDDPNIIVYFLSIFVDFTPAILAEQAILTQNPILK
jgi:hypothetical protein